MKDKLHFDLTTQLNEFLNMMRVTGAAQLNVTLDLLVTHPLTSYGDGTSLAVASIFAMTTLGSLASFWSRREKTFTEITGQFK